MGDPGRSTVCCTVLVWLLVVTARAATITPTENTVPAIQAALDAANPGDTVVVPEADIDFGQQRLTLSRGGVSLTGAGDSKTIFRSSQYSPTGFPCATQGQDPLLCITAGADPNPIVISGIAFVNAAQRSTPPICFPNDIPCPGPSMGIRVTASGPSSATPSVIRDCLFRGFWRSGPTGMGVLFGTVNNWRVEGNSFVGTKQPLYLGTQTGLAIVNNNMYQFASAINTDENREVYDLEITHNTMVAGWDGIAPSLADVIRGISLSANGQGDRNWVITNNLIDGVTQGIRIRYASGTFSLDDVHISDNSVTVTRCGSDPPIGCTRAEVINFAPTQLDATNNWWGRPTGPRYPKVNVLYEPWIAAFTELTPCDGFCPTDIFYGNSVEPVIILVEASPTNVTAGDDFDVTITLAAAVLDARLDVTAVLSDPDFTPPSTRRLQAVSGGITCQPVVKFSGTTVTTSCQTDGDTVNGLYTVTAEVTTIGNGGQSEDSTAVQVVQGASCIPPASIKLAPTWAAVKVNAQLPSVATVLDASGNPLPGVTVTFTITTKATPPHPGPYGYRHPNDPSDPAPLVTTATAVTDGAGQALLFTTASQPGVVTIQASAPDCTGNLVKSTTSTLVVVPDKQGKYGGDSYYPADDPYAEQPEGPYRYRHIGPYPPRDDYYHYDGPERQPYNVGYRGKGRV